MWKEHSEYAINRKTDHAQGPSRMSRRRDAPNNLKLKSHTHATRHLQSTHWCGTWSLSTRVRLTCAKITETHLQKMLQTQYNTIQGCVRTVNCLHRGHTNTVRIPTFKSRGCVHTTKCSHRGRFSELSNHHNYNRRLSQTRNKISPAKLSKLTNSFHEF